MSSSVLSGSEETPKTIAAAIEVGWIWATFICDNCSHRATKRLEDFTVAQARAPLRVVFGKLRCTACLRKDVSICLGMWEMESGQPFARRCQIK